MEEYALSPSINMFGSLPDDTNMDFDIMDDLLSEGCWLETRECSNQFQQGDFTYATLLDSSCFSPTSGIYNNSSYPNTPANVQHDDTEKSGFNDTIIPAETPTENVGGSQSLHHNITGGVVPSEQLETYPIEEGKNLDGYQMINSSSETSKRWWIESRAGPSGASVKERIVHVLRHIMESTKDGDVLAQIWVPIKSGGRNVLTTSGQPFSLNRHCQRLVNYRTVSTSYLFSAEEDSNMVVGLPGRVFLGRLPEWTPDVRYFSKEEYPRVNFAQEYDVRGTIALPVFERGSQACLGVVEVVMTAQKINYRPEIENICNALQAVDLSTSEVSSVPHFKVHNDSYQVVLPEIMEIMRAACETHRLPLAQTWVPCIQQGKKGSRHTNENYAGCFSTVDAACCVSDPRFWGFHDACSEHHLLRGQGVAGKAFTTNQPCFIEDITALSKAEYPLSHYAKMFSLHAAVAIRLRSVYTGTDDYVLEFFLPLDCRSNEEQKLMLESLSLIIQQVCRNLRVVTVKELQVELVNKVIPSDQMLGKSTSSVRPNREEVLAVGINPSIETSGEKSSWNSSAMWGQKKVKNALIPASLPLEFQNQEEYYRWDHTKVGLHSERIFSDVKQQHGQGMAKNNAKGRDSSFGKLHVGNAGNEMKKRRTKSEKTVTLQVLQQYFAGSLKDAAKSIGVCPTTLKRICRQHGITRWPSRKIKKVGNSLRKLQVVIDSVQGTEGVVQISSLYANLPKPHGSGSTSQNPSCDNFSKQRQTSHPKSPNTQSEDVFSIVSPLEKSQTSSGSQSSSSSLSCSTAAQPYFLTTQLVNEYDPKVENRSCMLKRASSAEELHASCNYEETRPPWSQSHQSLNEHPSLRSPSLPKSMPLPQGCNSFKVKVLYGEEKVRFSLHPSWGFQDLLQEIAKRFNIDDVSVMALKYLDDDSEWVLLTCDADLQECKDVFKSSRAHAMKLAIHLAAQPNTRNSLHGTALS